jgi:hypothetical protein
LGADAVEREVETVQARPHRISWKRLPKHVFDIDMSYCPNCGVGELEIIAALVTRPVIEKALVRNERPTAGCQNQGRISLPELSRPANHRHGLCPRAEAGVTLCDMSARRCMQPHG